MLIGMTGLAGAGKTTAIYLLEQRGRGVRVYLGAFVTAEVVSRNLPRTPASEKQVRDEIRACEGMDALARRALPTIHGVLAARRPALIDAICCPEEQALYASEFGRHVVTIAMDTSSAKRADRLSERNHRPLTEGELEQRDRYERSRLRIAEVMAAADHRLGNDGTLEELEQSLDRLVGHLPSSGDF